MMITYYHFLFVNYFIYSHSYHFLMIICILLHSLLILSYVEIYRFLLIFALSMIINTQINHLNYLIINQNLSIHYHHPTPQTHYLNHPHQTNYQTHQITIHKIIIHLSFTYLMPSSHSSLFITNFLQISIATLQKTPINVVNLVTIMQLYLPYSNLY
jgi:hypothetical protein